MPIRELADLTWEDVRDLDRTRMVAILPVGATEAHGPHLPLSTDVVIARAMARAGAEKLDALGFAAVILPALPYTAAPFAAGFAGTVSVSATTVVALVLDIVRELKRQEFAALVLANAHLDPAHLDALEQAAVRAREECQLPVVHPNLVRRAIAARLGDEFMSGACHAGRYEGSIVMAERPDLVRNEVRTGLPPVPASLSEAIRSGKRTFEEAGGPRAYFGWPADASADEGRATIDTLGDILAEAAKAVLAPEPDAP